MIFPEMINQISIYQQKTVNKKLKSKINFEHLYTNIVLLIQIIN